MCKASKLLKRSLPSDIVPKNGYIFLGSTGLYSDFMLSFSIWTVASKV